MKVKNKKAEKSVVDKAELENGESILTSSIADHRNWEIWKTAIVILTITT